MKTSETSSVIIGIVFFVETTNPDLEKMLRDKVFARNPLTESEKPAEAVKQSAKRKKKPAKR